MDQFIYVLLWSLGLTGLIQGGGFLISFALQTEVFYDVCGGLNFVALTVASALVAQDGLSWGSDQRKQAMSVVFMFSRGWLLLFLAWRAHDRGGDSRFDGVVDKFGKFAVFWTVQGMWVMLISLPMLLVNSSSVSQPFSLCDLIAIAGFAAGVVFEVMADVQKAVWVKAGRAGGFCTVGIWSYSRHPNYFGEMLQWWCAWVFAYASSGGFADWRWWLTILSPAFTQQVLMNIPATGLAQANGKGLKRYYDQWPQEYAKYRASTSILLPMVGYQSVPMFLKRTIFCDFPWYEYRPNNSGSGNKKDDKKDGQKDDIKDEKKSDTQAEQSKEGGGARKRVSSPVPVRKSGAGGAGSS